MGHEINFQSLDEWSVLPECEKKYLLDNQLFLKRLLIMNNAPTHLTDLRDILLEKFNFITLKFLLSRKYAQKQCFKRYFEVTSSTKMTLREFSKKN